MVEVRFDNVGDRIVSADDYDELRQVTLALFACVKILAEPDDEECQAILEDARAVLGART